jgi:hypothetical protein
MLLETRRVAILLPVRGRRIIAHHKTVATATVPDRRGSLAVRVPERRSGPHLVEFVRVCGIEPLLKLLIVDQDGLDRDSAGVPPAALLRAAIGLVGLVSVQVDRHRWIGLKVNIGHTACHQQRI